VRRQAIATQVWTIQSGDVLAALSAGRVWRARAAHVEAGWRPAYRWMTRAMTGALGPPEAPDQMPIWCWCQWRGGLRRRPDLRVGGHLPRGTLGVLLELQLAPGRMLRSDFELWHYVLNGWYLPASAADERAFEADPDPRRIEASWDRIFDLQGHSRRYTAARAERSVQGVIWELRPADVVQSTPFVAR
jgi:hypothetical protein